MYSKDYEKIRGMFWNGEDKDKKHCFNEEGIKYSIWRALRDYTARTESVKEGDSSASADKMLEAIPEFINNMILYFKESPYKVATEYDEWHHKMCELFIEEIIQGKIRSEVKYGKAQKIVNMSMKTIYCLEGSNEKAQKGYFEFCHMPLDSITINWFVKYVAKSWFNVGKKRDDKIKISLEGGPLPKWSNISFCEANTFENYCKNIKNYDKKNPYDYMFIVVMIREFLNQENNPYYDLTPFEAEFYIWPETQYEMAAESLIKQDLIKKLESNTGVSANNESIKSLNKEIKDILSKLSAYYSPNSD